MFQREKKDANFYCCLGTEHNSMVKGVGVKTVASLARERFGKRMVFCEKDFYDLVEVSEVVWNDCTFFF
jgi:hypothetical protein